jgi:hypothetical protein
MRLVNTPRRKFPLSALLVAGLIAANAQGAYGAALGPVRNIVFIGKSFNANIEVSDSTQGLSCINTVLEYGENRLSDTSFTLQNNTLRVRNAHPIDEPIVTLSVTVDCANPVTRSYTLFPEAPLISSRSSAELPANGSNDETDKTQTTSSNQNYFGIESNPSSDYILVQNPSPSPSKRQRKSQGNTEQAAAANNANSESAKPRSALDANTLALPSAKIDSASTHSQNAVQSPRPRLELDDLSWTNQDPGLHPSLELLSAPATDPAVRDAARARWSALSAQMLGDNSAQQAALGNVAQLSEELKAKDKEIGNLKTQLARVQTERERNWRWFLYGLLGLLGIFVGTWVWNRPRHAAQESADEKKEKRPWWHSASSVKESENTATADEPLRYRSKVTPQSISSLTGFLEELPVPDVQFGETGMGDFPEFDLYGHEEKQAPSPAPAQRTTEPSQTRSAVDLLQDVQQQADFSVALGQYVKAENLLRDFIAQNPATSPLAYLNLLGIYHAALNHQAFDALRAHFNKTFNAQIPDFEQYRDETRGLDSYPDTIAHIQSLWGSSDVIRAIEELLFRHPDSEQNQDAYTPLAYRELLLLYGMATETSATTDDIHRMQTIAADAEKWLQPNTISLDSEHPAIADAISSVEDLDIPLDDIPHLPATPTPTTTASAASTPSQYADLDFDLAAPIEIDLPLPDDSEATYLLADPSGLDFHIPDSDFSPSQPANNSIDFDLPSVDPEGGKINLGLNLDLDQDPAHKPI